MKVLMKCTDHVSRLWAYGIRAENASFGVGMDWKWHFRGSEDFLNDMQFKKSFSCKNFRTGFKSISSVILLLCMLVTESIV